MKRAQTNIDLLMHQHGIKTDKDLSNQLGMSQQQLSARLAGDISMKTLEIIANFFKVNVKDLLR